MSQEVHLVQWVDTKTVTLQRSLERQHIQSHREGEQPAHSEPGRAEDKKSGKVLRSYSLAWRTSRSFALG